MHPRESPSSGGRATSYHILTVHPLRFPCGLPALASALSGLRSILPQVVRLGQY